MNIHLRQASAWGARKQDKWTPSAWDVVKRIRRRRQRLYGDLAAAAAADAGRELR